jgi:sigma-E factor negative regulatory protein RseC
MKFLHQFRGAVASTASPDHLAPDQFSESCSRDDLAGIARVVAATGGQIWLEPEQTSSCGGCVSAAACGGKGLGTLANRLEARRFVLADPIGLREGDRVIVAFAGDSLIRAASVTYAIPLVASLGLAAAAQALAGQDGPTLLAAVVGLALGFGLMRLAAARMESQGRLAPRIVRRLGPNLNL